MRTAICREYGPPEVVRVEELPAPPLGPGQVRVGVRAAAVSYPDVLRVAGQYQVKLPVPFIPGSEYAGIVTEVAGDVVRPRIGDRMFGTTGAGSFGSEVVVAAGAVRAVPAGLNDRVAAAFGVAHRLAYHVLRTVACLQRGEELVVLGAGGGVGPATVQVHRNEEELMGLLAGGYLTPHVGAVSGLDQAAAALRYVADGRAIGTVVLDVAPPGSGAQWPDRAGTTAST